MCHLHCDIEWVDPSFLVPLFPHGITMHCFVDNEQAFSYILRLFLMTFCTIDKHCHIGCMLLLKHLERSLDLKCIFVGT